MRCHVVRFKVFSNNKGDPIMSTIPSKPRSEKKNRMEMIAPERLIPTPDNRRKPISDASVRTLAKSIKQDGMLQPIVVRPHPTKADCFEIRAGERRWRAARLAGLKEIPVIVRRLDNEHALAVTIAENMLRQNLHPLEEAEAIQLAVEREYDLKAIASRLGKSIGYLARRASLTRLSRSWRKEAARANSDASRLTAAHLELIARLPEPTQESLTQNDFWPVFGRGFPSVGELRRIIDGSLRSLEAMPWNPNDETLDPKVGACTNCPKRSSQQPMLFPEDESGKNPDSPRGDRCLDPLCFECKHLAFVQQRECKLREKHPDLRLVQIGVGSAHSAVEQALGDRIERIYGARFVKAGHAHAVPVMQIDGPRAGRLAFLDMGSSGSNGNGCPKRPRDVNGKPVPLNLDERRERLQRRRDAFVVRHVHEFLRNLTSTQANEIVSSWTQHKLGNETAYVLTALLNAFGTTKRADYVDRGEGWEEYDRLVLADVTQQGVAALMAVAQVWMRRLNLQGGHMVHAQTEDAKRMCPFLGLDFVSIQEEAGRAIPQPKSWPSEPETASPQASEAANTDLEISTVP
jgi:ParB/RepB/Spo0J family partition protein